MVVQVPVGDGSDDFVEIEIEGRQLGDGTQLASRSGPIRLPVGAAGIP